MKRKYEKPRQQDLSELLMAVGYCSSGTGAGSSTCEPTGQSAFASCVAGNGFEKNPNPPGATCVPGLSAKYCTNGEGAS